MKTIKQRISYAVMGLMAMGFTACTQNEDMAPTLKGQEINATFSVGGMQTRVNTLGNGKNWEDKDKLKVSIFTEYDSGSTTVLSFNSTTNEWSRTGSFRWLDESERHTILAVYPSDMDSWINNLQYDLQTDQSSEDKLKNADLITGYWYDVPRYDLRIPMQHRMSLVTIVYHVGTADYPNMDISEPQVYSKHTSVDFSRDDRGQFVMSTPTANPAWVKAYKHDDGMFSAIVIPGSYIKDEVFLKFMIGDNIFNAKMKMPTDFEEGKRYTYKLDVGKDKVKLTQISVDDMTGWTNEEDLK